MKSPSTAVVMVGSSCCTLVSQGGGAFLSYGYRPGLGQEFLRGTGVREWAWNRCLAPLNQGKASMGEGP